MSIATNYLMGRTDSAFALPGRHAADHTEEREAINAIAVELGEAPQGQYDNVQQRMNAIEVRLGISNSGSTSSSFGKTVNTQYSGWSGVLRSGSFVERASWWCIGDMRNAGLYQQTVLLYFPNGTLSAHNYANTTQYVLLADSASTFANAFSPSTPRDYAITSSGSLMLFGRNGAIASYAPDTAMQVLAFGHTGDRNLAYSNEHYWSIEATSETLPDGLSVDVVTRLRKTSIIDGSTSLFPSVLGTNIDALTPPLLFSSGSRLWLCVADDPTQPNLRTIKYADTGADGSLSAWSVVLTGSTFRLVGSDGGGGALMVDVLGNSGDVFRIDEDSSATYVRTIFATNVTWHDSTADGYNIVEHGTTFSVLTTSGMFAVYSTGASQTLKPFFGAQEANLFGPTVQIDVRTATFSLGYVLESYLVTVSDYPPRTLGVITDASPAMPTTHARNHSDARRAINAVVSVIGSDLRGDYESLHVRLNEIERRLGMTQEQTTFVDNYPPPPLDARTDRSPATPGAHALDHTEEREAINAIVEVLGPNPQGNRPSLQIRVEQIELLSYNN